MLAAEPWRGQDDEGGGTTRSSQRWLTADEFLERAFRISKRGYIYINNRLEGFAPGTIAEIIQRLIEQGRQYVLIT